jgi:hypothetical protein
MTSRRFLQRTKRRIEREENDRRGFNPSAMVKLSGFGAAVVVAAGVYVGFNRQGETIYEGPWGLMQRLVSPLFFGVTALELIVVIAVAGVAWRIWQRMR